MSDNSVDVLVADSQYCGIDDGRATRNAGKVDYRVRCYKAAFRSITRSIERMKKLWKEEKYRKLQARRQRRSEARRSAGRPAARHGVATQQQRLTAPQVFSLVEAPDQTLEFLKDLRRLLPTKLRIRIDLHHVKKIDPEAVAAFVAVIQSADVDVGGNIPRDQVCRQRLHDFGFFKHVKGGPSLGTPAGSIRLEHTGRQVEGRLAQEIIEFGLQKVGYTAPIKHGPAYNACTEAMVNTFQHAGRQGRDRKKWWAGVYYDDAKQAACFTLVDLGVGILNSISFLQRWRALGLHLLTGNQGEKLRMLLNGDVPSSTGERHRGRGLPNLKDACDKKRIQNLMILSNRAHAHVGHGTYEELNSEFRGTIIYWEVVHAPTEEDNG